MRVANEDGKLHFDLQVYLGELQPAQVKVELYADNLQSGGVPTRFVMECDGEIAGAVNGHRYFATIPASRPVEHFTPLFVTMGAATNAEAAPETLVEGYFMGLSKRSVLVA